MRLPLLSVVVPVLDECEGIRRFHERTTAALQRIGRCSYEIIYVDDGSSDGSGVLLRGFTGSDPPVRVIMLSRNFGHQIAITAALDAAQGDAGAFMEALDGRTLNAERDHQMPAAVPARAQVS